MSIINEASAFVCLPLGVVFMWLGAWLLDKYDNIGSAGIASVFVLVGWLMILTSGDYLRKAAIEEYRAQYRMEVTDITEVHKEITEELKNE